ncbi:MAG: group I truncated hemoglobin [Sciscionella sp.]
MTSIYEQIGGQDALVVVVDDLYRRILADPNLAGFFTGTNLARLKGKQVEFFADALGGPEEYSGQSMRQVHRGRGIAQQHFNLVAGHLTDALLAGGVPEPVTEQIIGVVAPLSTEIVSPAA